MEWPRGTELQHQSANEGHPVVSDSLLNRMHWVRLKPSK
jgi:hypothetical protein